MIGREAKGSFESFLASRGRVLSNLMIDEGLALMVAFYQEVRADDCPIPDDGDMLLFQSGETASSFEWSVTRQLIPAGDPDPGEVWQLALVFSLPDDAPAVLGLDDGDATEWCESPSDVDEFVALVTSHPATVALRSLGAMELRLQFDNAE